ncbi:S16 family serine protease [Streptomyces sp. NPDC051940]|uniref:S16 family serine protease n=1 Tax=Streptomyces sp. NPDC051940 TaxID=3155675 RepID=UPI003425033E
MRTPRLSRPLFLALCALPLLALLVAAVFAPLPFSIAMPGTTVNVLGEDRGKPVITVTGAETYPTTGQLRMTTISATSPDTTVRLGDVLTGWFAADEAVMPRDSVYPVGDTVQEVREHNAETMKESQDDATTAALRQLDLDPDQVKVQLRLADVGGPSAGLLFSLGIVDKLTRDDVTGGEVIAGTGTITGTGKVGAVGGVPLKTQAAERDGATVFLVPKAECAEAEAELPDGLRLVPVTTLDGALDALQALKSGGRVPSC